MGQPISIGATDTDSDLTAIDDFNAYNDIEALNRELVYDASRFGERSSCIIMTSLAISGSLDWRKGNVHYS